MSTRKIVATAFVLGASLSLGAVGCTTTTVRYVKGDCANGPCEDVDASATEATEATDTEERTTDPEEKPKQDAGSGTKSGSDAGSGPKGSDSGSPATGVDTVACVGPASSTGAVSGTQPAIKVGLVQSDPSGALQLVLLPRTAIAANDVAIALYFQPIPGQLSYPPNGASGCAVLRYTGSGWAVVDKTQLCDLEFSTVRHATASGVCDGLIQGTFTGVFSANQPLGGTFTLPSSVAASEIKAPSCRPMNSACSNHNDCCSKSCSMFIGVCN